MRLLQSDHPALLAAWGWRRPAVLLPAQAVGWTADRIRIVLSHEFGHIVRDDWTAQLAAELLRAACWFNPLIWVLGRRLRLESERACDDLVLACGWQPADYAEQLALLARTLSGARRAVDAVPAMAMARPSGLERRISAMLQFHVDRRPLTRAARWRIAGALLAFTCGLAGAVTAAQTFGTVAGSWSIKLIECSPLCELVLTNPVNQLEVRGAFRPRRQFEFVGLPPG